MILNPAEVSDAEKQALTEFVMTLPEKGMFKKLIQPDKANLKEFLEQLLLELEGDKPIHVYVHKPQPWKPTWNDYSW